ncbi:hypothetical protein RUND412_007840 [Rhizina undulata]
MEGSCFAQGVGLLRRDTSAQLKAFLDLVQSPYRQDFSTDAFLASVGTSFGISAAILLAWCFVRPHNTVVYAPKVRTTDEKRQPPKIGSGLFSWLPPLIKCHEADLVGKIGLDACIFLRFLRMCRNIFLVLGVLGIVVMVPVNVRCNMKNIWDQASRKWFVLMGPSYAWGDCMWAHAVVAWVFDFIIMFFLWKNYKEIVVLREQYFESPEYQNSLHARTLMISDVPSSLRSDPGLATLIGGLSVPQHGDEKCAIARNVKELPELIEQHSRAVRKLEEYLSKYLKNPDKLPAKRPVCKPDKEDKSMNKDTKVDAIEYLGQRIRELEAEIYKIRESIDNRDAMQYGFVSFPTISRAHIMAKAARGKHPKGTTIKLASKPNDVIWLNLGRTKSKRRWNGFIGNVLFFLLSLLFVVPNALIAVFISNLHNISAVWPYFGTLMSLHPTFFAVVNLINRQGVAAPTITSIIYLLLPVIMRRISVWQGDLTKTARERNVTHKLYFFFVFNNLIVFTLFGTMWTIIAQLVNDAGNGGVTWAEVKSLGLTYKLAVATYDISTYWITYLLQRNLGAMLDLIQLVTLAGKFFSKNFLSPTPRQMIEWTAPQVFDYASYYNYILFYLTIALAFAFIQPIVLLVAFAYFFIDSFLKKYLLMYMFVTKVESGGAFWRLLFNRFLFATGFFNCMVGLVIYVQSTLNIALCVLPLFPILIGFQIYCSRTFEPKFRFHTRGSDRESMIGSGKAKRKDNVGKRFGHPALYRPLITPMVHAKARHVLPSIYHGRINSEPTQKTPYGEIDMDLMQRGHAGKKAEDPLNGGFEVVEEGELDFLRYRNRAEFAEFAEDHGGAYFDDASTLYGDGVLTPPPGFASPVSSRPSSPAGSSRRSPPGLLPLVGNYRGADYTSVPHNVPNSPPGSFRTTGGSRPGSQYFDHSGVDDRSDTESITHLLRDPQPVGRGISHAAQGRYQQYEQYRQPGSHRSQQQQYYDSSYDSYRRDAGN